MGARCMADSVYTMVKKTKILSKLLDIFVNYMQPLLQSISSKGFEEKLKPYVKDDLRFNYAPN